MAASLLAVFAHPDDESFGPGGTLARYASRGVAVALMVASRGEGSTSGHSLEQPPAELGQLRERELQCAARVLGVREVRVLGYPDTRLEEADPQDLQSIIRSAIEETHPEVVLTFDSGGITGNPDHIAVSQATTRAFLEVYQGRPENGPATFRLYYWAVPDSIAASLRRISQVPFVGVPPSAITTIIDVNQFLDQQWQAIRCHRSQSDPVPLELAERLKAQAGKEFFVRVWPRYRADEIERELFV